MSRCDTCGNTYIPMLEITYKGKHYHFDCFECAIQKLAPRCEHCGCRIIGHGVEDDGVYFCCESCVRHAHVQG